MQETFICWLMGWGGFIFSGPGANIHRVGEVSKVKFGVGYNDGLVVAAGKSETCYSTNERTHIHGYMDLQALRKQ